MNKNDFYRQLFEQYAIDEEKIKLNVMKSARRKRTASNVIKLLPAAGAAAVIIAAGVFVFDRINSESGVDIISDTDLISAAERLAVAESTLDISAHEDHDAEYEEDLSVYVSFAEGITYNQMQDVFAGVSEAEKIYVGSIYGSDKMFAEGTDQIEEYAGENPEALICGAKLTLPSSLLNEIKGLSAVSLVESENAVENDEDFLPITDEIKHEISNVNTTASSAVVNDEDDVYDVTVPDNVGVPVVGDSSCDSTTTTTLSAGEVITSEASDIDAAIATSPGYDHVNIHSGTFTTVVSTEHISSESPSVQESENEEPVDVTETEEVNTSTTEEYIESTDIQEEDETISAPAVSDSSFPVDSEVTESGGSDELEPDNPEAQVALQINSENLIEAGFINNSNLLVLEKGSVSLYNVNDDGRLSAVKTVSFEAESPDIIWSGNNGKQHIIAASKAGKKYGRMFFADGISNTLAEIDVSSVINSGEISEIYCKDGVLVIKAASGGTTKLYYALKNSGFAVVPAVTYDIPVTVVAFSGDTLYYTTAYDNVVTLHSYNTQSSVINVVYTSPDDTHTEVVRDFEAGICMFISGNNNNNTVIFNASDESVTCQSRPGTSFSGGLNVCGFEDCSDLYSVAISENTISITLK